MTTQKTSTNGAQEPQSAPDHQGAEGDNITTGFFGPGQPEDEDHEDTLEALQRRINEAAQRIDFHITNSVAGPGNAIKHQPCSATTTRRGSRDTQLHVTQSGHWIIRPGGRGPQWPNDGEDGQCPASFPMRPLISPTGSAGAAQALPRQPEAMLCL